MGWELLKANTITVEVTSCHLLLEFRHNVWSETEFTGHEDLLTAGELETTSLESILGVLNILWLGTDGHENLIDGDTCGLDVWLTEGTSHTLLESICSSARKHFVDSDDMPWMDSGSHVEVLLTAVDSHVLVAGNSGSLKSLRGDLLLLVANQVDAGRESVELGLLLADVVHSKFGVWHTTVESRLWIWLVLLVPVAPRWSSWHY